MKHVQKFMVALLAMALVGCGGTGSKATPVVSTTFNGTPRVECIVTIQPTNLMHPDEWTYAQLQDPANLAVKADLIDPTVFGPQDPMNIEEGEQMTFQLVYYTTSGTRVIISNGVTFSSSDTTSQYGVLASNSGQLVAGNTPTNTPIFVTATYNGASYTTEYSILIRQCRILGTVQQDNGNGSGTTTLGLGGAQVQFFTTQGQLVDTAAVQFDGSIRASVPINTSYFTLFGDSLSATYYHSFIYLGTGFRYDANPSGCIAPMPANLIIGTTVLPGNVLVSPVQFDGSGNRVPTPPATGCGGPVVHKKV